MRSGSRAATSCTCPERTRRGGGARRGDAPGWGLGKALAAGWVLAALAASAPARAETQLEPILRLGVEGGYDSNPLFDGRGDARTRVSPDLGFKLYDHLWTFLGEYGADYLTFARLKSQGVWNHRGVLEFKTGPTPRTRAEAELRGVYALDPIGLAQAGVFRAGEQRALLLIGTGHVEQDLDPRFGLGGRFTERLVRFEDRTGGAMHAPSVDLLRRVGPRLLVGGGYSFTTFQDFEPGGGTTAYAQALRVRGRYRVTRFVEAEAYAGPAFWSGPTAKAIVPEAGIELRLSDRDWDLRTAAWHALGLGSTAAPGLVNGLEFGTVRRFGRIWDLRGDGGIYHSGDVPDGKHATVGFAIAGEAGWRLTKELRLALAASYTARLDDPSALLRRATIGVRMGWELPVR